MHVMIRIGTEFFVLSIDTAVSGSVTGFVAQKAKPHRLKIWNWLTSFSAVMAGKLETTVQYTCPENLSLLSPVTDRCSERNYGYQKMCNKIFTASRRGRVQYSSLKLPSAECGECHLREAVENTEVQQNPSVYGRRGIMALSPGIFPKWFSTHCVSCYCILECCNGQLIRSFLELGPLRSCWFHCWD